DIDPVWDIAGDPHQKNEDYPEGEREAQVIVSVFRPFRPCGEGFGAHQWQEQRPPEGDVEAGETEDDEAGCGHPMNKPLKGVEAHDDASRPAGFEANHAAREVED